MAQLWGGRFTKETDQLVYNFNASISFDQKFYAQDMRGSIAHVKMLAKQGILTEDERDQIKMCIRDSHMAIEDDYVRKNPFNFQLSEVIEDDSKPKVALSEEQEARLLDFMEQDRTYQKYHDDVLILLKTGLRISELCGLTRSDIDFKNHAIRINHQLLRDKDGFYIAEPKTKSGFRNVPMSEETEKAFKRVLKRKQKPTLKEIDGYHNFLFISPSGKPMQESNYKSVLNGVVKKYNKSHEKTPLPRITPHSLRHTFCTQLAQKNMNPKNLQYIDVYKRQVHKQK